MKKPTTKTQPQRKKARNTPTKAAPATAPKPKDQKQPKDQKPAKGETAAKGAGPAVAKERAGSAPPKPTSVEAQGTADAGGAPSEPQRAAVGASLAPAEATPEKPAGDSPPPAPTPPAAERADAPTPPTPSSAGTATAESTLAGPPATPDPRLPAVGTVIQKRDRSGAVVSECVVEADGIRYAGKLYRSLSAAAVAAARDRGKATTSANGFTYWGLSKPARAASADPLDALDRAWTRYSERLEATLEKAKAGEHRERTLAELARHVRILQNLKDEVP